jgi:hypothetical protein
MARILIIDDDKSFRGALAESIRDFGHDVVEVSGAQEAFKLALCLPRKQRRGRPYQATNLLHLRPCRLHSPGRNNRRRRSHLIVPPRRPASEVPSLNT